MVLPSLDDYSLVSEYQNTRSAIAECRSAPATTHRLESPSELVDLMLDCVHDDWDGHGAAAISLHAFQQAEKFLRSLPPGMPQPILAADPDGCVTFEWSISPQRLLLASVGPDFEIHYAALFGAEDAKGSVPFFGAFPNVIRDLVARVYGG